MIAVKRKTAMVWALQYDGTEKSVVEILQLKTTPWSARSVRVDAGDVLIHTHEGLMRVQKGDWIIKPETGILSVCTKDEFDEKYELI